MQIQGFRPKGPVFHISPLERFGPADKLLQSGWGLSRGGRTAPKGDAVGHSHSRTLSGTNLVVFSFSAVHRPVLVILWFPHVCLKAQISDTLEILSGTVSKIGRIPHVAEAFNKASTGSGTL